MHPIRLLAPLLGLLAALSGCVSPLPDYPVSVMSFDEGLLGTWSSQGEGGSASLMRFEACEVPVSNGRLSPGALIVGGHSDGAATPQLKAKAYRVVRVTPDGTAGASMLAYLISIRAGETLLGVQLADPVTDKPVFGASLPLHYIFKIRRDADQLRIWSPRVSIAWVPAVQWVDEAPAPGDGSFPPLEQATPTKGFYITSSIDRLLQIYRRYGDRAGFWESEIAQPLRRVAPE